MRRIAFTLLVVLVFGLVPFAYSEEPSLKGAPLNPEFIKYLNRVKSGGLGKNYGLIPLLFDIGKHKRESYEAKQALPSRYDLRERGLVTSVKDQGSYGTCWAFATFGALESDLLVLGRGAYDFSERNLINRCGYDDPWNTGGNILKSMAYLSRGDGPVLESQDPYSLGPGASPLYDRVLYVENTIVLPGRENVFDNEYIKEVIYEYGAVYTSMFYDDPFYDPVTKTYYCGSSGFETNHAIVLVGWDDNIVVPGAPGRGAWIVKNSWGRGWGDNGYFYISYYDIYVANHIAFFIDEHDINDGVLDVLYYDDLGLGTGLRYSGSASIYGANVFRAPYDSYLNAVVLGVSGYLGNGYVDYVIRVYKGYSSPPNVGSVSPDAVKSGRLYYTGYYTIRLDSPLYLDSGDPFVIVVELRPQYPDSSYPLGIELRVPGYSSAVTIGRGESFISPNGRDWEDLYNYFLTFGFGNISLKAIVTPYSAPPPSGGGGGGCSASEASVGLLLLSLAPVLLMLRRK